MFEKLTFLTSSCARHWVRKVSFSENFAHVLSERSVKFYLTITSSLIVLQIEATLKTSGKLSVKALSKIP